MGTSKGHDLNARYTALSDRFRSQWTFYQFLAGVFKHQGKGDLPFRYDFQGLYERVKALVPMVGDGTSADVSTILEFEEVERQLKKIHDDLSRAEREFAPSLLRKFFDHLKKQDEKILFALAKFYLQHDALEQDVFDKVDILLTRLAERSLEDGVTRLRDRTELMRSFEHLQGLAAVPAVEPKEERALIRVVRDIYDELEGLEDFNALLSSGIVDRYRRLKQKLGATALHAPVLFEIVTTNVMLKNRFQSLYEDEEARILEDTNRVFEIERYLEKNPGVSHDELRAQLEAFRSSRERFDAGRKDNNLRRHDILALRKSMEGVLRAFDPKKDGTRATPSRQGGAATGADAGPFGSAPVDADDGTEIVELDEADRLEAAPRRSDAEFNLAMDVGEAEENPGVMSLLPPDPLLTTSLHKIVFALELVVWDHPLEQAVHAKELHHLRLEPWEVGTYLALMDGDLQPQTLPWELQVFFLMSAALRIKMEEEASEIVRLTGSGKREQLADLFERSAQSLERAREMDRRFQWFIDDMLYKGETQRLEEIYRSHFRFLHAFSALWLKQQESGGVTPF